VKRILLIVLFALSSAACGPQRPPVPPGVVPEQTEVSAEDEIYGHEVLNELMNRYQLDNDDTRINRVRDVANRLTEIANPSGNPWHIYVLRDPELKNAGATRGNYIFVWTGMLDTVRDDDELATILAHEIGHVLAGHTTPSPAEEVSQMVAGIAGEAANQVLQTQGGFGLLGGLADFLIRSSIEGLLVNPNAKRNELEADQIGLFLMADAGFDPNKAVGFWQRVQNDPDFSDFPLAFLSSHPSSEERYEKLEQLLPMAQERYDDKRGNKRFVNDGKRKHFVLSQKEVSDRKETWVVLESTSTVRSGPRDNASKIGTLEVGNKVTVISHTGPWLEISDPMTGYVRGTDLAPFHPQQNRSEFAR
jgi:predicted Zn-dependent protease